MVIRRSEEVLATLESDEAHQTRNRLASSLPLFDFAADHPPTLSSKEQEALASEVEEHLKAIRPDELTPRAALDLVYELCAKLPKS